MLTGLTACSTIEVHEPVGCLGFPPMPAFSGDDLIPLSDEAFDKIMTMAATCRARIETQCIINEAHDELHN